MCMYVYQYKIDNRSQEFLVSMMTSWSVVYFAMLAENFVGNCKKLFSPMAPSHVHLN